MTQVQFFNGVAPNTTLLSTDTTAPYVIDLVNVAEGSYTLSAIVTDDDDAITTSLAVQFTVIAVNTTPQAYFISTDHLNTPRLITGATNSKVWDGRVTIRLVTTYRMQTRITPDQHSPIILASPASTMMLKHS